jgi:phospholipid/cholesterol/gamma-HCH transport system substrate-binding protein
MYLRATAILSKADTLMNDVNHYGLLFSQNKGWQRQRLQRVTALNALDSPQGFRQYFEREVDQINTSMSRLSMLIDKANQTPEEAEIQNNDQFRKDFAELMRQSRELSDNLRLYNQQLMHPAEK